VSPYDHHFNLKDFGNFPERSWEPTSHWCTESFNFELGTLVYQKMYQLVS